MPAPSRKPAADISAHLAFFPAAILGGLVAIPLWAVLSRDRPELALWHGHEMLLGYGLAVVAGFLLARIRRGLLIVLLGAWGLARIATPLGVPALGTAAALTFAALLAGIASSRFLRAAKKSRNAMFGLLVVGLAGAEALYQAGVLGLVGDGEARGLRLALDLMALLMLQMGGRVIPAATAGALQRRGGYLAARVQPRIETAIGALMAAVIVGDQVAGGEAFADLARLLVAALALVRLLRWRPWAVVDVPALISLHLGYAWLAAGLALGGAGAFAGRSWSMAGIHALGIGALGTLTLTMMARTAATRRAPDAPVPGSILPVVLLLSVAAVLRIAAAFAAPPLLLIGAAAAWTLAFLAFAALYLRIAEVNWRAK